MLNMDQVDHINKLIHRAGFTISRVSRELGVDRKTVRKYASRPVQIPETIKVKRNTAAKAFIPAIEDLLHRQTPVTNPKQRLTAKRIHSILLEGREDLELPDAPVPSIRTIERLVRAAREKLNLDRKNALSVRLEHAPGSAQLDFGEIDVFLHGETCRLILLVLTFPHSNYRMAVVLPAQNFECLAYGIKLMFDRIGRVPLRIRFDNMSTAVSQLVPPSKVHEVDNVHDVKDHPRVLTENFRRLQVHYGFEAEFCNPAAGNEKGSVENAVGWIRRNFFVPALRFDGNFAELNSSLMAWLERQAEEPHYKKAPRVIKELFLEDLALMLHLPAADFDPCSWVEATVDNTGFVRVDKNDYQVNAAPGQKVHVCKRWDTLSFYDSDRTLLTSHKRHYGLHKDFIDWKVMLGLLRKKPTCFKDSALAKMLGDATVTYLTGLRAQPRREVLEACYVTLKEGTPIELICARLDEAVRRFGHEDLSTLIVGFRGLKDTPTDNVQLMDLPEHLSQPTVPSVSLEPYAGLA